MSTPVGIIDSRDGVAARVTRYGQLVVSPLDYSTPVTVEMTTINTAYNMLVPETGKNIVITDVLVSADKNVSPTAPAEIEIYEADAVDSLTPAPSLVRPRLISAGNLPLIGLNVLVPEGKWLNAKTNDGTVLVTVMYYRVPVEDV